MGLNQGASDWEGAFDWRHVTGTLDLYRLKLYRGSGNGCDI